MKKVFGRVLQIGPDLLNKFQTFEILTKNNFTPLDGDHLSYFLSILTLVALPFRALAGSEK